MRGTFVAVFFLVACGSNGGPTTPEDLSGQPVSDLSQPADLKDAGHVLMCGMMVCGGATHCCVTQSGGMSVPACTTSCPDGGLSIQCGGTEDCSGNPCCL